jgi:endonuclease YncB( thermonuclease family)
LVARSGVAGALLLTAWVTASAPAGASPRAGLPGPIPAEMVRVVDGDTLEVRARIWLDQVVETLVRLDGIDTPEIQGDCDEERRLARLAREALVRLIGDRPVALLDVSHDKYGGRVRATVLDAAGIDLGVALIEAGLARPYDGGAREPWCPEAAVP